MAPRIPDSLPLGAGRAQRRIPHPQICLSIGRDEARVCKGTFIPQKGRVLRDLFGSARQRMQLQTLLSVNRSCSKEFEVEFLMQERAHLWPTEAYTQRTLVCF